MRRCRSGAFSRERGSGVRPEMGRIWCFSFLGMGREEDGVEVPFAWPLVKEVPLGFSARAGRPPGEAAGVLAAVLGVRRRASSGATRAAAPEGVSITGAALERWEEAKRSRSREPMGCLFCARWAFSCSYFSPPLSVSIFMLRHSCS